MNLKPSNLDFRLLDPSSSDSRGIQNEENDSSRSSSHLDHYSTDSDKEKDLKFLENPNKSFYILISCLLAIDSYFLLYLIPEIPFFNYCSSTFYITGVTLSKGGSMGRLKQSFAGIDCKTNFPECGEVCLIIEDLNFSIIFLLFGVIFKFLFTTLGVVWLVIKNYRKNSIQIRVIYLISETLAFLSLISAYLLFTFNCQLSRLESIPGTSFSYKTFHYSTISFLIFMIFSRLFAFFSFKSSDL